MTMAGTKKVIETGTSKFPELSAEEREALVPEVNPAYHFASFADEVKLDVVENKRVLLTGHAGCGKTSLFEQIAAETRMPFMRVNMNGQTTISDFVGCWTAKGGSTEYIYGILPYCMMYGIFLVVDEIDFAEASILSVLNPVLEKKGSLFLKEKGNEIIKPHPNFRIFATANTVGCMEDYRHIYQGANIMNRALLDRFRIYHVDYLPAEDEIPVLVKSVEGMKEGGAKVLVEVANAVREAFNKEELSSTFSLRQLIDFGELLIRMKKHNDKGLDTNSILAKAAEICIYSKVSREDMEVIKGIIQRVAIQKNK